MVTWFKTTVIAVLCCLIGVLASFGVITLAARNAQAQTATAGTAGLQMNAALPAADSQANISAPGVGSTFVTEVYKKVSPSVVHITNRSVTFSMFYGYQEGEATGSGVIVDKRGYVLTNDHVIEGAKELVVITNDGKQYAAEVVGADPGTDLALLKIKPEGELPAATLGDSGKAEVGEWVIAIGNPRGYDWTVTVGIVSALNRESIAPRTGQTIRGLIQTDAAINPGNSGGPLLNAKGEVIGINELIVSTSGGSQGIGLAIPINTAKDVLGDLIQYGRVKRPWLGVTVLKEVNSVIASRYNLPVDHGVVVEKVLENSPASGAGIKSYFTNLRGNFAYDIITAVNGTELKEGRELLDAIRNMEPGASVKLTVYRIADGQYQVLQLNAKLQEFPSADQSLGII
jgi:S1-C subfamily serine protease